VYKLIRIEIPGQELPSSLTLLSLIGFFSSVLFSVKVLDVSNSL